ncbi:hypothetical protein F5B20DRAFT_544477 [Whalleya microplaca]|nr:hypothetical protein F5B20DRAFT_544477 [Whalleya microplaca]
MISTTLSLRSIRSRFYKRPIYGNLATMATAHAINLAPNNTGLFNINQSEPSAKKATELLQKDLAEHHVFFNYNGFHNHISHHILALYGTGASSECMGRGYDENTSYQRPAMKPHENPPSNLKDWENAKKCVGKEQYYPDFLAFYQDEIEQVGWQKVLQEHLFKGDERSEDMLVRLFAGLLHPLLQLMYGIEWQQPAIVAMALAQTAVHGDHLRKFLIDAEKASKSSLTPMPYVVDLLEEARSNEKMSTVTIKESDKRGDAVLSAAWDETIEIVGRVNVKPDEVDERTAEMYHAAMYEGISAALHPGKEPRFDFGLIHHINVCPLFPAINSQTWLSNENKARLLEWKIRLDIVQYAERGCPPLSLDRLAAYVPKDKNSDPLTGLLHRLQNIKDDGHATKLYRAVGIGQKVCEKYEDKDWMKIKGDLWTKAYHLVVDSVESPGERWVFNVGQPAAWKDVPDRPETDGGISEKLDQVHL